MAAAFFKLAASTLIVLGVLLIASAIIVTPRSLGMGGLYASWGAICITIALAGCALHDMNRNF